MSLPRSSTQPTLSLLYPTAHCLILSIVLLADRTATQYDRLLLSSCRRSVRLSVTLYIVALGVWCSGLKVVPACS